MPKQEQSIPLHNTDTETALALSYEAMKNLGWTVQYAGDTKISGSTPKTWKSNAQQILVGAENDTLTISSEMVNGESFDIGGKNKKNVAAFLQAFAAVKANANAIKIDDNKAAIDALRAATIQALETEAQTTAAVNEAMNLHSSKLYVTYAIIAINVLVFVLMLIDGAGIMGDNSLVHIKWGANYAPLTLTGDWWRLITSTFIHFGIIHVGMNMYCLYTVGVYLEPMLGKSKYIVAYLCTGVFASLVSLWWHKEPVISAGASGAVFGMFGLFLALLTTNLIPKQVRQSLLQSIGIFIAFNLFYGMKGGVDNAAHVGGLVSGFVIGYLYVYCIKKEKVGQKLVWIIPALLLITAGATYGYLQQNKGDDTVRKQVVGEVKDASYKDNDKFQKSLKSFDEFHDSARSFFNDTTLTDEQYAIKIDEIAKPAWEKAEAVLIATKEYDISPQSHTKAEKLLEYIIIRRKELEILQRLIANVNDQEALLAQLKEVRAKADAVFESALEL
jgi:rhomboid protease GluP